MVFWPSALRQKLSTPLTSNEIVHKLGPRWPAQDRTVPKQSYVLALRPGKHLFYRSCNPAAISDMIGLLPFLHTSEIAIGHSDVQAKVHLDVV